MDILERVQSRAVKVLRGLWGETERARAIQPGDASGGRPRRTLLLSCEQTGFKSCSKTFLLPIWSTCSLWEWIWSCQRGIIRKKKRITAKACIEIKSEQAKTLYLGRLMYDCNLWLVTKYGARTPFLQKERAQHPGLSKQQSHTLSGKWMMVALCNKIFSFTRMLYKGGGSWIF